MLFTQYNNVYKQMQGETKMVERLPVYFHSSVQTPEPQPRPIKYQQEGLKPEEKRQWFGKGEQPSFTRPTDILSLLSPRKRKGHL